MSERMESNERVIQDAYLPIPGAESGFGAEWHFGDHLLICKLLEDRLGGYFPAFSFTVGPDGAVMVHSKSPDSDPSHLTRHQVIVAFRIILQDVLCLKLPAISPYISELPQELIRKEIEALGGHWRKKILGILPNIRADAWNAALDKQAFAIAKKKLDDGDWRLMIDWYKANWEKQEGKLTVRGQIEHYRRLRRALLNRGEDASPEHITGILRALTDDLKKQKGKEGAGEP